MRVAVSGTSGLVGTELCRMLGEAGHTVVRIVRERTNAPNTVYWNWELGEIDAGALENCDAVIHLAGVGIADKRWNDKQKNIIMRSRVEGTGLIGSALRELQHPPKVFMSASAVGYYGNRGFELLTEQSEPGRNFLSELCCAWESAATATCPHHTRCVCLRFGVVLDRSGGALKKMLLPFQLGVGGPVGSGRQYMSWISLPDTCRAIIHCLNDVRISGPVNIVGPEPVNNREFSKTLAKVLFRPCLFRVPAFVLRALFGELADEALLSGNRVAPKILEESGFTFSHPTLTEALKAVLKRR